MRLILQELLSADEAAAGGCEGDFYLVFSQGSRRNALLLITLWDGVGQAQAAFAALREYADSRFGPAAPRPSRRNGRAPSARPARAALRSDSVDPGPGRRHRRCPARRGRVFRTTAVKGGLDLSRLEAGCFDLNGILVDTDDVYVERLADRLAPYTRFFSQPDPTQLARRLVLAAETPADFLFGLPDRYGLDNLLGPLLDRRGPGRKPLAHHFRLIPGVREALLELHARFPLAIISVREASAVNALLDAFGLRPLFGTVAAGRTVRRTKPHPVPIEWAARPKWASRREPAPSSATR